MTRSWINRRDLWRAKALEIRAQFDENKNIEDPRQAQVSIVFLKLSKMPDFNA